MKDIRSTLSFAAAGLALLMGAGFFVGPALSSASDVLPADAADGRTAALSDDDPSAIITPADMFNRIYFLAHDGLLGRDTPSPGLEAAAGYLVSESRRMGLEPGVDGSFYQRWPYRLMGTDLESTSLFLQGPAGERAVAVGTDAAIRGGTDMNLDHPLMLVGGCNAVPEEGQMAGMVAVFCLPVEGPWSRQAQALANRQARFAEAAGAVATIHMLADGFPADQLEQMAEAMGRPFRMMGHDTPGPQIFMSRDVVRMVDPSIPERILELDHGEMEESGSSLAGRMPLEILDDAHPANVVGLLPGSDPVLRDEFVVLSAHYDHVGVGTPVDGDSIYNGADDNASGTAALLEVARALTAMPEAPRRSVLFVWVAGEEKGLLGAEWFVDNSPFPTDQMVANINADMISGNAHADSLIVIGKDYSTLGALVDEVNSRMDTGLITSDDIWPEQRFFFRSDQFHFMRKEIPALFFFTGIHECYHRPCDTIDFVDYEKAAKIARLLANSTIEIANADERPQWYPDRIEEVREMTASR